MCFNILFPFQAIIEFWMLLLCSWRMFHSSLLQERHWVRDKSEKLIMTIDSFLLVLFIKCFICYCLDIAHVLKSLTSLSIWIAKLNNKCQNTKNKPKCLPLKWVRRINLKKKKRNKHKKQYLFLMFENWTTRLMASVLLTTF